MTDETRSLIVVPTYNEAENIEPLVLAVRALDADFDILIVDDSSPDGTGEIADRLASTLPGIHVLHRPGKMGLDAPYVLRLARPRGRRSDKVPVGRESV